MKHRWHALRLLPDAPAWVEVVVGGGAAVLLLWSRLALLASGPWEWDEVIFARGLMRFELGSDFPHPPGFPGWMAIGHLMRPFVSEPLHGLQLASALFSLLLLWPLAALGRRAAPAPVALAGALLVLMTPGAWLHAVRGFTSTPAAFFMAVAAVAVAAPRGTLRPTTATLLLAASFLIRPQLLPALAVLWLVLAVRVSSARRLAPGVLLSLGAGVLSLVVMAHAEGGWGPLLRAFVNHGTHHFSRLAENPMTFRNLGLVKAFGGPAGFVGVGLLALLGCLAWRRRRGRLEALTAALVVLALVFEVVMLQNRTYTRYTVPAVLALGPLAAAGAAAVAPPMVAAVGLLGLAVEQAAVAYPLLVEQHRAKLPGWAAVDSAFDLAARHHMDVVVEGGLYPFASYRWFLLGGGSPPEHPALVLSPWAPEPWLGVTRNYVVVTDVPGRYPGPLAPGCELKFGGVSADLVPLTQQRFLEAAVLVDPPLPVGRWWPVEKDSRGRRFMWGSRDAALDLPPLPAGTWVCLELQPARGPAPLEVVVNHRRIGALDGTGGRRRGWIEPRFFSSEKANRIEFRRNAVYPPGHGDTRALAVRLDGIELVGPGVAWGGPIARAADRRRLQVELEGAWRPERFPGLGWGVWLRPRARLRIPAGAGLLHLTLVAPRPTPSHTVIRSGGRALAGPVDVPNHPTQITVPLPPPADPAEKTVLELESTPFVPAAAGGGRDTRELGVVISALRYEPARRWPLEAATPPADPRDPAAPAG